MPARTSYAPQSDRNPDRFRFLREVGARALPTFAAELRAPGSPAELVVVERLRRGGDVSDADAADFVRDARALSAFDHPHLAHVREVAIRADDILVVWDFIDGERLADLYGRLPLEVSLRVLVDVLSGLTALHNLRGARREPLKLVHRELSPSNIVLGTDGVARVIHACRVRTLPREPSGDDAGYCAPEVLLGDGAIDARADVYSVGVMLWEALTGARLFANEDPGGIVTRLLSGRVPRATPDAAWAAPLADLAARALSVDPNARFASAAELAAEIRRIAAGRIAVPVQVAACVAEAAGEQVSTRRARWEREPGIAPWTGVDLTDGVDDLLADEPTRVAPPPVSATFAADIPTVQAFPPMRPVAPTLPFIPDEESFTSPPSAATNPLAAPPSRGKQVLAAAVAVGVMLVVIASLVLVAIHALKR